MSATDDREFYFQLGDLVRSLPDAALHSIGQALLAEIPGRDWRSLGDSLNYTVTQMDSFAYRTNPGYAILRDWSTRERSTIGTLRSALQRIGRDDVISVLDNIRQNPITLYVVIYDPVESTFEADIRGRRELWEGLIPYLRDHLQRQNTTDRYSFCQLKNSSSTWRQPCHSLKGQQIDITITHENSMPMRNVTLEEMAPQWHLVTPSIIRFSRETTAEQDSEASGLHRSGERDEPSAEEHRCHCARGQSAPSRALSAAPSAALSAAPSEPNQTSRHTGTTFDVKDRAYRLEEISDPQINNLRLNVTICDDSKSEICSKGNPFPIQCTCVSLEQEDESPGISLHSEVERPQDLRLDQSPTEDVAQAADFRSPVENECLGLCDPSVYGSLDLRSDADYKSEVNSDPESNQNDDFRHYFGLPSGETRKSETKNERQETDSIHKTASNSPENHEEKRVFSEMPVNSEERTQRRHVYYGLPSTEMIRQQYPELWSIPGFHPKLKHKTNLAFRI